MQKILYDGNQEIALRKWYECAPADSSIEFHTETAALHFLRQFLHNPWNMLSLRAVLAEELPSLNLSRCNDQEVLEQLVWRIVRGQIKIVPRIPIVLAGPPQVGTPDEPEPEEPVTPVTPPVPPRSLSIGLNSRLLM